MCTRFGCQLVALATVREASECIHTARDCLYVTGRASLAAALLVLVVLIVSPSSMYMGGALCFTILQ